MAKPAPIRATLRPLDLAQHLFEVALTLPAEALASGAVAAMPAWTPGSYLVRDYARFVDRVRLQEGRKERPLDKLDKQRWQLPPSKRDLTVRYRVYGNDLTVRTNHVDASHAQIIPAATFLYLEGQLDLELSENFAGEDSSRFHFLGYNGSANNKWEEIKSGGLKEPKTFTGKINWAGLDEGYFLTAMIPAAASKALVTLSEPLDPQTKKLTGPMVASLRTPVENLPVGLDGTAYSTW